MLKYGLKNRYIKKKFTIIILLKEKAENIEK